MEGSDTSTKSRRESPSLAGKMTLMWGGSVFLICAYIYMYTYNVYMHVYSYTVIHLYIYTHKCCVFDMFWYCVYFFSGVNRTYFPSCQICFAWCWQIWPINFPTNNANSPQSQTSPACPTDLAKATPKGSNEPWPTLHAEWAHRDLPPVRISIPWNMWKPVLTSLFHGFWQPV